MPAAPTVLVANRGEIAVRVLRTLRRLGWRSVAVYADADVAARHVRVADTAERLGGTGPARGYLDIDAIVAAARRANASLVHPGYGFLSENADFAVACAEAGLTFVGPPASAISLMGDKIRAKRAVEAAGTPVLPGFAEEPGHPLEGVELSAAAAKVGYPLLLKPAAGGGGKGMRRVARPEELVGAAGAARREAAGAFGDTTLLAERLVEPARHVEVQILADTEGHVVHLGERECSLQRRHQKIVEEAPSPAVDEELRVWMGEAAVAAAKACGYVGAGTVEFIVPTHGASDESAPGSGGTDAGAATGLTRAIGEHRSDAPPFAFLEMNTRLQVEHPVTEEVVAWDGARGVDLVELQLRVALGEPLPFAQADLGRVGHAVEARVYAEDPARGFLPAGGRVLRLREPAGDHVRVDSGLDVGTDIGSAYDPLLSKVIAWGADREDALRRLHRALASYTLLGCATNVSFLRALLTRDEVRAGDLDTALVERIGDGLVTAPPPVVFAAAALDRHLSLRRDTSSSRFTTADGWRVGTPVATTWRLTVAGGEPVVVRTRPLDDTVTLDRFEVAVGADAPSVATVWRGEDDEELHLEFDGVRHTFVRAALDGELWLGRDGASWQVKEEARVSPLRRGSRPVDPTVRSPMPGTVISVEVEAGQHVSEGETLAVVEAMKMEHAIPSPISGTVSRLEARHGQTVAMDAVLAVVTADEPAP
ncbi:acetyl/propionyl-CoA carboxylase subunit alpha [Spiractinospora alimapuensis]|uniref:acetyl/propionyl/methylcrotonyl-CoA carboxylase subunit alpha n=1 Tax=Spiractinospora alimapuensis TaxID=2820884 RepID=UPI001F4423D8|nr:biotin carboxylase N-terminal domain-containing protein [Spiractinospora alimapuensis]QVQ53324.1 acetyl/propionyl-CoA carboxylase subunit alpha [Spiractinospora alimapuensis]